MPPGDFQQRHHDVVAHAAFRGFGQNLLEKARVPVVRFQVVRHDVVLRDAQGRQQQQRGETRAVLAGGAVEQQCLAGGGCLEKAAEGRLVAGREFAVDVHHHRVGGGLRAFAQLGQEHGHGHVAIQHGRRDPGEAFAEVGIVLRFLGVGAKIDDGFPPQRAPEFQVGGTGAAGIAAAKELAVTQPPAIRAGQAAQVAGVVHAVQREAASAGGKRLVGRIRTGHGAGSLVFEACRCSYHRAPRAPGGGLPQLAQQADQLVLLRGAQLRADARVMRLDGLGDLGQHRFASLGHRQRIRALVVFGFLPLDITQVLQLVDDLHGP
ncbi:hypothetical protein G6F68_010481 [Rhizopus microsporus]|nr:hypothetical protein G6F68_010481 [Rhizopus microsporus]